MLTGFHFYASDDLPDRNCDKCVQCCVDYDGWLQFQNCLYKVKWLLSKKKLKKKIIKKK